MKPRARARMSSSAYTYAGVPNSRGQVDHVAAADLEPAALVQARAQRIHVRDRKRRHGAAIMKDPMRAPHPRAARARHPRRPRLRAVPARGGARRGGGDPPRRRLGEGEPLRLRARLPRRRDGGAGLRRARARAVGGRASGRARSTTRWRWRAAARARSGDRAARLEHGRLPGDPRRRRSGRRDRARWWRSARRRRTGCARFLRSGQELHFRCDAEATEPWLESLDIYAAAASLGPETALLLLHARGDEQVPYDDQRGAARRRRTSRSACCCMPGGHHRSIQHDVELQADSRRFIRTAGAVLRIILVKLRRCPRPPTWRTSPSCARRCSS